MQFCYGEVLYSLTYLAWEKANIKRKQQHKLTLYSVNEFERFSSLFSKAVLQDNNTSKQSEIKA